MTHDCKFVIYFNILYWKWFHKKKKNLSLTHAIQTPQEICRVEADIQSKDLVPSLTFPIAGQPNEIRSFRIKNQVFGIWDQVLGIWDVWSAFLYPTEAVQAREMKLLLVAFCQGWSLLWATHLFLCCLV